MHCRAFCLLHCSDVLRDTHRKVCTRYHQNLANPGDEECSCTAGTAHYLSCWALTGVTSRTLPVQQCPGEQDLPAAHGPQGWVCHGTPSQKLPLSMFCSWGLQQRALRVEDFVKSTWNRTPFSFCYIQVSAERVGVSQGLGLLPHMEVRSPRVHPTHWHSLSKRGLWVMGLET